MLGRFLKHYGKGKIKQGVQSLNDAIVAFDPDGATEAAIEEMQENFDTINIEFSKAKQEWEKEQKEADAIVELYNKRLAAAEHLQGQLEEKPNNRQLKAALDKLVGELENMSSDVETEQEEAADAKEVMDELQQTVDMYASKLKTARSDMKKATRSMEKAKRKEERAKDRAERAAVAAGLKETVGGLSSALASMNRQAEEANAKADAAERKAKLLGPTNVDEDPAVAAALAAVSGEPAAPTSATDRLAALKRH